MRFAFVFVDGPEQAQTGAVINNILKITFTKFDNTLGIHPTNPLPIGTIAGHDIWFVYSVRKVYGTPRHNVEYSFYVAKEARRG